MPRVRITDEYSLVKRTGSDNWYLEWREDGEKKRHSCRTQSVELARERAREFILEAGTIRDERPADMSVAIVIDRYQAQHGLKIARKSANKRAAKLWKEFWGDATVADLTVARQDDFAAWLYGRGYSQNYVRATLALGKAALNRAWQRQEITQAPFVRLPEPGEGFKHKATTAQLAAFLNAIPEASHLWVYTLIRLNTGCRGDAALDLSPFQIDFEDGLVALNPTGRKQTKKYRSTVRLTNTLRAVLQGMRPRSTYVGWHVRKIASVRKTWNKVRVAAHLPPWFSPKIIRHTVATELRRRGVPGWEVSGLLGHKGGDDSHPTTAVYAKYDPSYLSKSRKALDAWMGELARLVPRLRGVSAGSVRRAKKTAPTRESRAVPTFRVVEPAGIEPATSTMPLSGNFNNNSAKGARRVAAGVTRNQGVDSEAGSVRGQRKKGAA